jgi:hypothetical protein
MILAQGIAGRRGAMSLIMLRTWDGHYLAASQGGQVAADSPGRTAENLWELVALEGGKMALRTISPPRYVCVRDGLAVAAADREPDAEPFVLVDQGQGRVALQSAGGLFLRAEGGGGGRVSCDSGRVGPWETFGLERYDEVAAALNGLTCCCGLRHPHSYSDQAAVVRFAGTTAEPDGGSVAWSSRTHRWLVDSAAAILLYHQDDVPEASVFAAFWANPTFQQGVFRGLLDADFVYPYNSCLYSSHFYDPDTKRNIFGDTEYTAYTQCLKYFAESQQRARQILTEQDTSDAAYGDAGYALGLSLHYLTDLTQPMHAANFANILPTLNPLDWRHSGFEEYLEAIMEQKDNPDSPSYAKARALQVDPADVSAADLAMPVFPTVGALVDEIARHSKYVFIELVKGPAEAKVRGLVIERAWTAAEADPANQAAVPYGQKMAARYLVEWARLR